MQTLGLLKMPANQSIYDLVLSFKVSFEKSLRHIPHQTQLSAFKKDEEFTNYAAHLLCHNITLLSSLSSWEVKENSLLLCTYSKILYCHYPCKYLNSIHIKVVERANPLYVTEGIFVFSETETLLLLRMFCRKWILLLVCHGKMA